MRNPIFSVDTLFLDQRPDGSIAHFTGIESRVLSKGERIIRLETAQALVEITAESGKKIIMSPETAFSLQNDDNGNLVRYSPVNEALADIKYLIDWSAPVDLDNASDLRRWVIVGMVCASGTHSLERHRPSNLIAKPWQVAPVMRYLTEAWSIRNTNSPEFRRAVRDIPMPGGSAFIKSSIVTTLVGSVLSPKTQAVNFDPNDMDQQCLWAFFYGLLSSATEDNGALIFSNRAADTVRVLSDALFTCFGIPNTLSIHPMEREVLTQRSGTSMPHHFRLSPEDRAFARLVGFDPDGPAKRPSFYFRDKIAKIRPLEKRTPSVIVMPGEGRRFPLTANSFVFSPEFEMPEAAADLAAHPEFVDSCDPAAF